MNVAWTALLLAILCQRKADYFRHDRQTGKPIRRSDGSLQYLSLCECIHEISAEIPHPVAENLRFFVGLRDLIEHALMPELDLVVFGECQAMLINYEQVLAREFGDGHALNESLAMSLQFSQLRSVERNQAARLLHSTVKPQIRKYIDAFRSSLSDEVLGDMGYSFKVFMIPNVANHRSRDALAVEWVHYDLDRPEEMANYLRTVALIKDRHVPVANVGCMKAGDVADQVSRAIGKPFTASHHHAQCWRHYRVRPPKGDPHPERCDAKYCVYDKAHTDYVYTEAWVEMLIHELKDDAKLKKVMMYRIG